MHYYSGIYCGTPTPSLTFSKNCISPLGHVGFHRGAGVLQGHGISFYGASSIQGRDFQYERDREKGAEKERA